MLEQPGRPDLDPYLHVVGRVALCAIAGDRSGLRRLGAEAAINESRLDLSRLLGEARTFVHARRQQIVRRAVGLREQLAALTAA
jgi:hypothetical protein